MASKFLDTAGLSYFLQKLKGLFASKDDVPDIPVKVKDGGTGATDAVSGLNNLADIPKITEWQGDSFEDSSGYLAWFGTNTSTGNSRIVKRAPSHFLTWIKSKLNEVFMPLSGGTFTGPVKNTSGGYYVHKATGTSGTAGYVGVARITISGAYTNIPLYFKFDSRSRVSCEVWIQFKNLNGTDPDVDYIRYFGSELYDVKIVKADTSIWDVYVKKSESYDAIYISDFFNAYSISGTNEIKVAWTNVHSNGAPSGAISATAMSLGVANNVAYATCGTAAGTAAKEATISGNADWKLQPGAMVGIKFTNSNTASNVTINVNGTGAKSIWYNNAVYTGTSTDVCGYANRTNTFMYDGTYWVWIAHSVDNNSTYSNAALGQGYGTCTTAAATAAKVVTLANYALTVGGVVSVKFSEGVPASATMNINSKGAKNIFYRGAAITADIIVAGDIATFIYDGTQYHLLTIDRNPLGVTKANGYWGLVLPGQDTTSHFRVTANGIIPNVTDTTNGSGNVGTSAWPFKSMYAKTFYGALSGNASTASSAAKWTTARYLDGISVDGSGNRHHFALCDTAAATAAKVATVEDSLTFSLVKGAMVFVKFTNANGVASPTLNVNNTGAKNIYRYGTTAPSTSAATSWQAGSVVCFIYDGSYWQMVGWLNDNTNTDTKVTETVATDSAEYPILTKNTTATATITDTAKFAAGVTINPSSKQITATTFKGALSGNASTATSAGKWTNARNLGGISVDGSGNRHWFATCDTAAATAAKAATVEDSLTFTLAKGAMVFVKFTNSNTVANPTLNVNSTGAKNIYRYGTTAPSTNVSTSWSAGSVICLVYDGSYWQMVGWLNSTYANMTAATASAAGSAGLVPAPAAGKQTSFLRGDGTWVVPTNTTYANMKAATADAAGAAGLVPAPAAGKQTSFLRGDGTWVVPTNTTYGVVSTSANGLAPKLNGTATTYLNGNGSYTTPPNTTYSNMKAATADAAGSAGLVPAPGAGKQTSFLRGDGTWVVPTNTTYTPASLGFGYGTCATAEATAAKVVTLANYNLVTGGIVAVKFTYAVPAQATMNINSKGAKNIFFRGAKIKANVINAATIAVFIYDGTQYNLLTTDSLQEAAIQATVTTT